MDVHFLPRIADKALLLGLVRLSDVFVFPSTVEAMSMMLLEAAALGVPVLASSIPENVDILPDSEGLFLPGDAEDLARAYRALKSESASAIRAWCQHRSSFMRSHYDWGRIADEYEAVYERAVQARNTQSGKELDSGTTGHPCKSEQV
jgi:glycosyltransferase involved in cell wall biosynthesis